MYTVYPVDLMKCTRFIVQIWEVMVSVSAHLHTCNQVTGTFFYWLTGKPSFCNWNGRLEKSDFPRYLLENADFSAMHTHNHILN